MKPGWEWIIVLLLAVLLFGGYKKLPEAARGIGRSLRVFKAETRGLVDDDETEPKPTNVEVVTALPPATPSAMPPPPPVALENQPPPPPQPPASAPPVSTAGQ